MIFHEFDLGEMIMCLEDLINYFAQPEDDIGKEIFNVQYMPKSHLYFSLYKFLYA